MNRAIAKYLLYFIEQIRGEKLYTHLKELENNTCLSQQDLRLLQKEKLNNLLDYTMSNNRYYKNKYKGYDILAFESLPILTKEELRDNFKKVVSDNVNVKLDLVETSGSTGVPLQFYRDRIIFGYTLASLYRGHRWWGIDVGSMEAMLWGVPISFIGKIKAKTKDLLLNRFRENEYNINPQTLLSFFKRIEAKRPDYIFGYSSMVYEFALFIRENNLKIKNLNLKAAICTAEKIQDYQRSIIEEVLGCRVVSEYGSTETGIISYECKNGSNHISDDCIYLEIVDDKNVPVPDGQSGRVLVTVLNSFSSPIIRYDLGDISSKSNYSCQCGLNLSILGEIKGRTSDVAVGPNGEVYHSIIFYYILKELTEKIGGIRQYKVHQRKTNLLDFYIVKSDNFSIEAEQFLKEQIRIKFGDSMTLNLIYQDYIERKPSGKLKDFETDLDTSTLLSRMYSK